MVIEAPGGLGIEGITAETYDERPLPNACRTGAVPGTEPCPVPPALSPVALPAETIEGYARNMYRFSRYRGASTPKTSLSPKLLRRRRHSSKRDVCSVETSPPPDATYRRISSICAVVRHS